MSSVSGRAAWNGTAYGTRIEQYCSVCGKPMLCGSGYVYKQQHQYRTLYQCGYNHHLEQQRINDRQKADEMTQTLEIMRGIIAQKDEELARMASEAKAQGIRPRQYPGYYSTFLSRKGYAGRAQQMETRIETLRKYADGQSAAR